MNNLKFIRDICKLRQWSTLTTHRCGICNSAKLETKSSSAPKKDEEIDNEPVPFFGSQAATWRAKDTRSGGADDHLWYQPYVISGSLTVFLLYFCVFREENDIDRKLEGNLFDHVQGLEEIQLTMTYKYNKENGLENTEVIKRLHELGIDVNLLDSKVAEMS